MASEIAKHSTAAFFKEPREFPKRFASGFPIGKRTEARMAANKDMNKAGIKHCEIRLHGCQGRYYLSWAHSTKSRFILTDKDWRTAARACAVCHQTIEVMPHSQMKQIVLDAIARRAK